MIKQHYFLTGFFVFAFLDCTIVSADSFVSKYGITEGDIVENGFVFIDGLYIASPYEISRRGLSIYINDNRIMNPTRHPGKQPLIIKGDPERMSEKKRSQIVRKLDATREIYEENLKDGKTYFFCSDGAHILLDADTSAYDLPNLIKVIQSDLSIEEKISEFNSYHWEQFIDVETFITDFRFSSQLSLRLEELAQNLLKVDEFGSSDSKTVHQGFMFIDGKYIEAPYVIERRGLGVFINGNMIERPQKWPVYMPSAEIDPQLPKEINEDSSINDDIVNRYLMDKQAYLHKHHIVEEAEKMYQVIKDLPFVTQTRLDENNPTIVHFTTTEGHEVSQSLISLGGRVPKMDKDSVLNSVKAKLARYQKGLDRGGCFFIFHDGTRVSLSQESIKNKLPALIETLCSSESPQTKKYKIGQINLTFTPQNISVLVSNYDQSVQLEMRLNLSSK